MSETHHGIYAGLISGTSADAMDGALLRVGADEILPLSSFSTPLSDRHRSVVAQVAAEPGAVDLDALCAVAEEFAMTGATVVANLLRTAEVDPADLVAIGSHGQTVLHRPEMDPPYTLQLDDPARLAVLTGTDVVADFRRTDMALGGQGAPLLPHFHSEVLGNDKEVRGVLNLGGIANLSVLEPGSPVRGFDTGPANTFMDGWVQAHRDSSHDEDGVWAASAAVDAELLKRLMDDDWFRAEPPKSTGREAFSSGWLAQRLTGDEDPAVVQSTLCQLTVETVAWAVEAFAPELNRLLVCGGGADNRELMRRLRERLAPMPVEDTIQHGIHPGFMEASAFAWFAHRRLAGLPNVLASVTGGSRDHVAGGLYLAPR